MISCLYSPCVCDCAYFNFYTQQHLQILDSYGYTWRDKTSKQGNDTFVKVTPISSPLKILPSFVLLRHYGPLSSAGNSPRARPAEEPFFKNGPPVCLCLLSLQTMHWHLVFSAAQSFHSPPSSLRKNVCQELAASLTASSLFLYSRGNSLWCLQ